LIEPVRAQRLADTGLGLRITSLLDDFSGEEWVRLVYACIQHGDHGAAAVVSRVPCLIGFDERRAVGEHREEQHVVEDAFDVGVERERGALLRPSVRVRQREPFGNACGAGRARAGSRDNTCAIRAAMTCR
jgi:hypothetical protein